MPDLDPKMWYVSALPELHLKKKTKKAEKKKKLLLEARYGSRFLPIAAGMRNTGSSTPLIDLGSHWRNRSGPHTVVRLPEN